MDFFSKLGSILASVGIIIPTKSEARGAPRDSAEDSSARRGPRFGFVCLESEKRPANDAISASFAKWFNVPADKIKIEEESKDPTSVISVEVDGLTFMIARAPMPVPKADIEYACGNSFLWPEAAETLAAQEAHLIVMTTSNFESPAAEGLALSRAIAACTECFPALAVYWGHAATVYEPEMFRSVIEKSGTAMEELPVMVWVGFLAGKGASGGTDYYTSGLDAFGVMDIEIIDTRRPQKEVLDLLTGLASYGITAGNVIRDGDTVGDPDQKIKTHHAVSAIGRKEKVLRVDF